MITVSRILTFNKKFRYKSYQSDGCSQNNKICNKICKKINA